MLDGMMLLWFVLTACALLFVAIDIRSTPESPVLKWGFVLVTAYTGVVGAFLYVLGCREPLPNTHERYVMAQWRQTLGSTMHCVAGDGIGILVGAVLAGAFGLNGLAEFVLEYALGFAFGWMVFQALFMREMAGGSYARSLTGTFIPELLSMNLLMAGMMPTMMILKMRLGRGGDPTTAAFWFVMSMALLVGAILAYPINWWLVLNHLKHGMMTMRRSVDAPVAVASPHGSHSGVATSQSPMGEMAMAPRKDSHAGHGGIAQPSDPQAAPMAVGDGGQAPRPSVPVMTLLSFVVLAIGLLLMSLVTPFRSGMSTM
jgi:Domain of unknown function (DUF4396)